MPERDDILSELSDWSLPPAPGADEFAGQVHNRLNDRLLMAHCFEFMTSGLAHAMAYFLPAVADAMVHTVAGTPSSPPADDTPETDSTS